MLIRHLINKYVCTNFIVENLESQTNKHYPKLKFPCGVCVTKVNYNMYLMYPLDSHKVYSHYND